MKKFKKIVLVILSFVLIFSCSFFMSACNKPVSIQSIEKTDTTGFVDTYTIYYTNGTTSTFTITNGQNGKDGKDGKNTTIQDIYEDYCKKYGEISYKDFLKQYLTVSTDQTATVINSCLLSCLKVYTEFAVSSTIGWGIYSTTTSDIAIFTGSAVVYKIDDDYTYVITNYHVVFDSNADATLNNNSLIARKIYGYLYGSESAPTKTESRDENNLTIYNYGDYAIPFEYVGGSISNDLAVLKTPTSSIKGINPNIKAINFADEYYVGETAIAIGNPEDEGISVTQGIISIDNEYITLAIDNTSRSYRSIRIDTALYSGNSGGGLFDNNGNLIGITNAGNQTDENINYAIPLSIVKGTVENILYYYNNSPTSAYKIKLGITVTSNNSKYVYDNTKKYGTIKEDVVISEIVENSIAQNIGLNENDIIKAIQIGDITYTVNRYFDISDIILKIRINDNFKIIYTRNGEEKTSLTHNISQEDLIKID